MYLNFFFLQGGTCADTGYAEGGMGNRGRQGRSFKPEPIVYLPEPQSSRTKGPEKKKKIVLVFFHVPSCLCVQIRVNFGPRLHQHGAGLSKRRGHSPHERYRVLLEPAWKGKAIGARHRKTGPSRSGLVRMSRTT